jgi:hypothetical protein
MTVQHVEQKILLGKGEPYDEAATLRVSPDFREEV